MSFQKEEELALLEGPAELLKVVQLYLDKKEYEDALRVANDTLELARDIEDDEAKEEALEVLTRVYLVQDDVDGAVDAAREAVSFYKDEDDMQGQAAAMSMLASMLMKRGDTKEALQTARDSIQACEECGYGKGKAAALAMLTRAHTEKGETAEAVQTTQEWLAALKEIGDKQGEGEALNSLMQLHLSRGENDDALHLAKEMARLFKAAGDAKREAAANLAKAKIYAAKEAPDQALRSAEEALKLVRASSDTEGLRAVMEAHRARNDIGKALDAAAALLNLFREGKREDRQAEAASLVTAAGMLLQAGDPETALQVAEEGRAVLQELRDSKQEVALLLDVVVNAHLVVENSPMALAAAEDAVVLARLSSENLAEATALQVLARIRMDMGNAEEALQAANEVVAVYSLTNNEPQQAQAQYMVAQIELSMGSHEVALSSAEAALGLFRRVKDREGEAAVLETVAQAHQAGGRSSEALKASEEAHAIFAALGNKSRATAASQSTAAIRFANQEVKDVLREAKAAAATCREKGDRHGEAQQQLLVASARLEQASKANPNMDGNPQEAIPIRRLMEGLMAGKDALELFREEDDVHGEAAALLAVAKVYRFKQEPVLAIEWAKQAAVVHKAIEDWHGAAASTMLEATTLLMMVGVEVSLPDGRGGMRPVKPAEEALCAAQDGLALFQGTGDVEAAEWAVKVVSAAQELVDQARQKAERQKPAAPEEDGDEQEEEVVMAVPPDDTIDPFAKMGYDFKNQVEIDNFLKRDPRERGLPLPAFRWTPPHDPVMDRLVSAHRRAVR